MNADQYRDRFREYVASHPKEDAEVLATDWVESETIDSLRCLFSEDIAWTLSDSAIFDGAHAILTQIAITDRVRKRVVAREWRAFAEGDMSPGEWHALACAIEEIAFRSYSDPGISSDERKLLNRMDAARKAGRTRS